MIKTFKNKALKDCYNKGDVSKLPPAFKEKIIDLMFLLQTAPSLNDLKKSDGSLHELKGNRKNEWSLNVSANFRLTFQWKDGDVFDLDLEDYHKK